MRFQRRITGECFPNVVRVALFAQGERYVVRADGIDHAVLYRVPETVNIPLGAQRRHHQAGCVSVLRGRNGEVGGGRLREHIAVFFFDLGDHLRAVRAGYVHNVNGLL